MISTQISVVFFTADTPNFIDNMEVVTVPEAASFLLRPDQTRTRSNAHFFIISDEDQMVIPVV